MKRSIPLEYFCKLDHIEFLGNNFYIPSNAKEYLAYRYGEDWRIPKQNWLYWKDELGLQRISVLEAKKMFRTAKKMFINNH